MCERERHRDRGRETERSIGAERSRNGPHTQLKNHTATITHTITILWHTLAHTQRHECVYTREGMRDREKQKPGVAEEKQGEDMRDRGSERGIIRKRESGTSVAFHVTVLQTATTQVQRRKSKGGDICRQSFAGHG